LVLALAASSAGLASSAGFASVVGLACSGGGRAGGSETGVVLFVLGAGIAFV
jgi:hypothetical protein